MDKKAFLKKLHNALRLRVSVSDRIDILSEYKAQFIIGQREGKSEQQLCAEFGDPRAIAAQRMPALQKRQYRFAYVVVFLALYAAYFYDTYKNGTHLMIAKGVAVVALSTILLGLALKGYPRKASSTVKRKTTSILLVTGHALLLALATLSWVMMRTLYVKIAENADVLSFYQNVMVPIRIASVAVALLVALVAAYGVYRKSAHFFTLVLHSIGTALYINAYHVVMRFADFSDPYAIEYFTRTITSTVLLYGFVLMWVAAVALYTHSAARKVQPSIA